MASFVLTHRYIPLHTRPSFRFPAVQPHPRRLRLSYRFAARPGAAVLRMSSSAGIITDIDPASTDTLLERLQSAPVPFPDADITNMVIHLGDSRGLARLALVDTFGRIGSAAVPALLDGLKTSPNPVVRRSCGKALAKIGDSSATSALLHTLVNDDDTVTRSSAAGALARMGATAVEPILALISDPAVGMTAKGHAAWAIAFMQGDAALSLFTYLDNSSQDVRLAVVGALGAVAIGDALPTMGASAVDDWVDDDNDPLAQSVTNPLQVRNRAIDALQDALDDESAEVRAEAVTALANAGCVQFASRIAGMLDDTDAELRRCAALSLMKLGDVAYVDILRAKSEDDSEAEEFRRVAALAATTLQRKAEDEEEDDWDD